MGHVNNRNKNAENVTGSIVLIKYVRRATKNFNICRNGTWKLVFNLNKCYRNKAHSLDLCSHLSGYNQSSLLCITIKFYNNQE